MGILPNGNTREQPKLFDPSESSAASPLESLARGAADLLHALAGILRGNVEAVVTAPAPATPTVARLRRPEDVAILRLLAKEPDLAGKVVSIRVKAPYGTTRHRLAYLKNAGLLFHTGGAKVAP